MKRPGSRLAALLCAAALALGLAGCGHSFKSDSVRAARALAGVESLRADTELLLELAPGIINEGETLGLAVRISAVTNGDRTSGEAAVSTAGMDAALSYIAERQGEDWRFYLSLDGGESWLGSRVTGGEIDVGQAGFTLSAAPLEMLEFYLELASGFSEPVDCEAGSVPCRRYDGVFPGERLIEALRMTGGGSIAESLPEDAEIPDVPLSVYFGAEDSLPRRLELDLTGALAQYMDEALGLPGLIAIDSLTVSVTLGDYGSAVPATPPAEL